MEAFFFFQFSKITGKCPNIQTWVIGMGFRIRIFTYQGLVISFSKLTLDNLSRYLGRVEDVIVWQTFHSEFYRYTFSLSISMKNVFCLRNERSSVIGSI